MASNVQQDLAAINSYFIRTPAVNLQAEQHKKAWVSWYKGLTWMDLNLTPSTIVTARSKRDNFNLVNVKSTNAPAPAVVAPKVGTTVIPPGPRPTLRQGMTPANQTASVVQAIKEWQTFLKIKPDGNFGSGTKASTVAWQKPRGLTPDGIVGPLTWTRAQTESTVAVLQPQTIAAAAQQAAAAVAAVAKQPIPSAASVAQVAAQVAATPPPKPKPKPPVVGPTTASALPMPPVVESVKATIVELNESTPLWLKIAGATIAGIAGMIGFKALNKPRRA